MKIKIGIWIYGIISFVILSLAGCKEEYKTTTRINSDGSCERVIIAKVDSLRLAIGGFHVPQDKSWDLQSKTIGKDTQKVYIVHKNFDDVNKINNEYKNKDKVGIEIKFEKKFRWFFSYLTYKEIYKSYNRFNRIPVKSYLTREEYSRLEAGDTSNALNQKMDNYLKESLYEEFFMELKQSASDRKDSQMIDLITSGKQELKDSLLAGSGEIESVIRSFKNVFKSGKPELYKPEIERVMKSIQEKFESMSGIDGNYTNEVIMPGIILNTNANTLEGNKATWKFDQDKFCFLDQVMIVESRVSNIWTIYVTGGVIVVVIALILLPGLRRKKMRS